MKTIIDNSRSRFVWPSVSVVAVVIGSLIPLIFNSRYYFVNDTESGAYGQWYEIGRRILSGNWALLNPDVWQSGNYQVEASWGIYSPFLWIVGVASHAFADAVVFSSIVKIVCLAIAAGGLYLLARTYGISRPWAAVVATAVPLAGFTMYYDAPSWVNGLMAWCLFPITIALARRSVFAGRTPLLGVLSAVLMVGVGYVAATLFLGVSLVAIIVEAALTKQQPVILRAVVAALTAGLFAIVVHLPGLLTSSVSGRRPSEISNDGFLTVSINDLLMSGSPAGGPLLPGYNGLFPNAPITYIAWFLPLLVFIDWKKLFGLLRSRVSLPLILLFAFIGVSAPSQVGPLRFPIRVLPYLVIAILLLLALGISKARRDQLTPKHLYLAGLVAVVSGTFMFFENPGVTKTIVVVTAAVLVLVFASYRSFGGIAPSWWKLAPIASWSRFGSIGAVIAIVGTVGFLVPQHFLAPLSPLPGYGLPAAVADYTTQLSGSEGSILVVGGARPSIYNESLIGNSWYIGGKPVQNAYTSVYYPAYTTRTCMQFNGDTCSSLYGALFKPVPDSTTDTLLVDLLGVSSLQLIKANSEQPDTSTVSERQLKNTPDGWHIVNDTPNVRLIVRDEPIDGAGGIAWSSVGTQATVLERSAVGTTLRIDSVPASGGTVALRLIPWPGYTVAGATLTATPVDDMLLGVDVTAADVGKTVTVTFWSPGWPVQVAAGALIVLISALLAAYELLVHQRAARSRVTAIKGTQERVLVGAGSA